MPTETQKTVVGLLLVGASMLTGNAVLITIAGGVGVNLTSEGLAGLWGQAGTLTERGTPLSHAGERAIRRAVETLRRDYLKEYGRTADTRAFDLVRDCAGAVLDPAPDLRAASPLTAQQALAPALGELLHGHEPRQVERLQRELLPAVAEAFRDELAADTQAWARYHGWLIERLTAQSAALTAQLADLPAVLDALRQQPAALDALRDAFDALEAEIAALRVALERLAAGQGGAGTTFDNTDMEIGGSLNQAGGDLHQGGSVAGDPVAAQRPATSTQFKNDGVKVTGDVNQAGNNLYQHSAHVQGSGSAFVFNGAVNAGKINAGGTEYIGHEQIAMPGGTVSGGMLAHLLPDIQRIPHGSADQKALLITLVVQLGVALAALPVAQRQDTEAVADLVTDLIAKVGRAHPNPTTIAYTADNLERAAMLLGDHNPMVCVYAAQISATVCALGAG
ncbi:hypothetical protein F8S13_22085 [Chloroflexia bacterium SDU3-3]|nr:hypothetical protein F8S13_22085 [Chloroflexia bacterium SDU3-3]